jgi:transposase-like protein
MQQAQTRICAAPKVPAASGAGGLFPDFATLVGAAQESMLSHPDAPAFGLNNPPASGPATKHCRSNRNADLVAQVLAQYQAGVATTKAIAREFGISASVITFWATKAGLPLRPRGRRVSPRPQTRTLEMVPLAQSKSQVEVAQCLRVSKQAVNRALRRWGNNAWVASLSRFRRLNDSQIGGGKSHILTLTLLEHPFRRNRFRRGEP